MCFFDVFVSSFLKRRAAGFTNGFEWERNCLGMDLGMGNNQTKVLLVLSNSFCL